MPVCRRLPTDEGANDAGCLHGTCSAQLDDMCVELGLVQDPVQLHAAVQMPHQLRAASIMPMTQPLMDSVDGELQTDQR